MTKYRKGTVYYEITKWVLEHYREMKYYKPVAGGEESIEFSINDVLSYMDSKDRKGMAFDGGFSFTEQLLQSADAALRGMKTSSGHRAQLLYMFYMDREFMNLPVGERVRRLGYTMGGFYKKLYSAISDFAALFWYSVHHNRYLPFYAADEKGCSRMLEYMEQAAGMHEKDEICYKDTERILKDYIKLKYSGVQERLRESQLRLSDSFGGAGADSYSTMERLTMINIKDDTKNWMVSSMAENTGNYISMIDCCAECMRKLGLKGEENYRYLYTMFLNPQLAEASWDEKRDALGLTQRVYYCRRQDAITMLSKILWGPLSHRHVDSVFYRYARKYA